MRTEHLIYFDSVKEDCSIVHMITFSIITKPGRVCGENLMVVALVIRTIDNVDFPLLLLCFLIDFVMRKCSFYKMKKSDP